MTQQVVNPTPFFIDADGNPLENGQIYVGVANSDPITNPITAYYDQAGTVVAQQPIRTSGGVIINGAQQANIFVTPTSFSIKVLDYAGQVVAYAPVANLSAGSFQPLDTDLTAIAALVTTTYGRGLLTLANQAALQAAVGYTQFSGGTITSPIKFQGAGAVPYFSDNGIAASRIFIAPASGADPTSQPGDVWLGY